MDSRKVTSSKRKQKTMTSSEQFKIHIIDKWREMKESRATNIIVLKSKHNRKQRSRSIVLARRRQQFWNTHSCSRQDVAREERKQFSVGSSLQECWTKNLAGGMWDKCLWTVVLCSGILGVSVACSSFWNFLSTISSSWLQDYTLLLSASNGAHGHSLWETLCLQLWLKSRT